MWILEPLKNQSESLKSPGKVLEICFWKRVRTLYILSRNISKNMQVRPTDVLFQACLVTLLAYQFSLKNSYHGKSWSNMLSFKTCTQTFKKDSNQHDAIFLSRLQPHCKCGYFPLYLHVWVCFEQRGIQLFGQRLSQKSVKCTWQCRLALWVVKELGFDWSRFRVIQQQGMRKNKRMCLCCFFPPCGSLKQP